MKVYLPDQEKNDGSNADKTVMFEIESSSLWGQCVRPSVQSLPDRGYQGKHRCWDPGGGISEYDMHQE